MSYTIFSKRGKFDNIKELIHSILDLNAVETITSIDLSSFDPNEYNILGQTLLKLSIKCKKEYNCLFLRIQTKYHVKICMEYIVYQANLLMESINEKQLFSRYQRFSKFVCLISQSTYFELFKEPFDFLYTSGLYGSANLEIISKKIFKKLSFCSDVIIYDENIYNQSQVHFFESNMLNSINHEAFRKSFIVVQKSSDNVDSASYRYKKIIISTVFLRLIY